jgi:hypothetical protein
MRSSPPTFSPGTASPLLPVEVKVVDAQPFKPDIASENKNHTNRFFIDWSPG